jgi:PAS domain S-box-containing protein
MTSFPTPHGSSFEQRPPTTPGRAPFHSVQFYEHDGVLVDDLAAYVSDGVRLGRPTVAIVTAAHRGAIEDRLTTRGVDLQSLRARGGLVFVDAHEALAAFMQDGMPSADHFAHHIGTLIDRLAGGNPDRDIHAYGEMVDVLWQDGRTEAAIRLEELWNQLLTRYRVHLHCAYALRGFADTQADPGFAQVCDQHARVIPSEGYVALADDDARLREIARLQLQAERLQQELARREVLEQELRRSKQELEDFLEYAAEGLHWVGPNGIILWANRAELELLGYARDEYIGHHIAEFYVDQAAIADVLARLARNETLREYEARLRCKDGSIKHVLVSSNVLWHDGRFVHTRCFTRDITELKHLQLELEDAVRVRDDFLSIVAHELRNPLNAVHLQLIGVLRALRRDGIGLSQDAIAERVGRADQQVERLSRLLDNLLDVSRVGAHRLDLECEPVDLAPVVRAAADRFGDQLRTCELHLPVEPVVGEWDRLRLDQVVTNLLSNAVKFGQDQPITVRLADHGAQVLLSVQGRGIGIDAEGRRRLFGRFERAVSAQHFGGFGLGLWITRQIVEAMDGAIEVDSQPGEGTTFTVVLPKHATVSRDVDAQS